MHTTELGAPGDNDLIYFVYFYISAASKDDCEVWWNKHMRRVVEDNKYWSENAF